MEHPIKWHFFTSNPTPKQPHCFTGFKFENFGNVHKIWAINLSERKSICCYQEIQKFKEMFLNSNEQFLIRKNIYEWFAIFRVMFMKKKTVF